jgi:hypothetical protein
VNCCEHMLSEHLVTFLVLGMARRTPQRVQRIAQHLFAVRHTPFCDSDSLWLLFAAACCDVFVLPTLCVTFNGASSTSKSTSKKGATLVAQAATADHLTGWLLECKDIVQVCCHAITVTTAD